MALARARALAGVGREAKRTYHFTAGVTNNEGFAVQSAAPGGMNGPAREGRYYDYGAGPAGRLLIVEHINDANAVVTYGGAAHARVPHFHVFTNVAIRAYDLDGRFGEAGQANTHHIYY